MGWGYLLDHPDAGHFVVYITANMPVIQAVNPEVPNPFPTKPPRTKRSAVVINLQIEEFNTMNDFMNSLGDVSKIAIFKDENNLLFNELNNLDVMIKFFTKTMIGYYSKYSKHVFGLENSFNSYKIVMSKQPFNNQSTKWASMKKIKMALSKQMGTDIAWYQTPQNAIRTITDIINNETKNLTKSNVLKLT